MDEFDGYQVHVLDEDDLHTGGLPSIHSTHETRTKAWRVVREIEAAHPNRTAWVVDEFGNVLPREEHPISPAESVEPCFLPPNEEYIPDPATVADDIQRGCPHNWQMMGDGLFHCYYFCGVRPHKPHHGEVND